MPGTFNLNFNKTKNKNFASHSDDWKSSLEESEQGHGLGEEDLLLILQMTTESATGRIFL